jgi:hypothetical protein
MARKYSNVSVETTLTSGIDSSQTSIAINDTGGLPASFPYSLIIDFEAATVEVVTVTNLSGGTLTVVRGEDGTAAQSHDAGAEVVHGVTARDLSEPQQHIDATDEVHGLPTGSVIVGTLATQTLTNKTIDAASNTLTNIGGDSLATTLSAPTVDATFQSVTLSGPDPDVDVATELAGLRTDLVDLGTEVDDNATDISALEALFPPSQIAEVATDFNNFTSAAFTATSTPCEITFTANSVGRGMIHYAVQADADNPGERLRADIAVHEDDIGGAVVATPNSNDCINKYFDPEAPQEESFSYWRRLSGLTPGGTYFAQLQFFTGSTTVDILNQKMTYVPVP